MKNNDEKTLEAFLNVLPPHKTTSGGWKSFDCPECGDTRSRGSFIITPENGFRYHCFNGGCTFNDRPTGWEPGSYIGGRVKKIFMLLGGRLKDLPLTSLLHKTNQVYEKDLEVVKRFDEIPLPDDTVPIIEPGKYIDNKNFQLCLDYIFNRMEECVEDNLFHWSPNYPKFIIVPYKHYNKNVGWFARHIETNKKLQRNNPDYIYKQDTLDIEGRSVLLLEGIFDAIAVQGCAVKGTKITQKQINLLNDCGKDKIVVPDQTKDGINLVNVAEENDWFVSTPNWDFSTKDPTEAVEQYGRLYVIEDLVKNRHKNYLKSKFLISVKG